jgi:hypothetical protein
VFTPDLFFPVQYLIDQVDEDYARSCRVALLLATGRVAFPSPPAAPNPQEDTQAEIEK